MPGAEVGAALAAVEQGGAVQPCLPAACEGALAVLPGAGNALPGLAVPAAGRVGGRISLSPLPYMSVNAELRAMTSRPCGCDALPLLAAASQFERLHCAPPAKPDALGAVGAVDAGAAVTRVARVAVAKLAAGHGMGLSDGPVKPVHQLAGEHTHVAAAAGAHPLPSRSLIPCAVLSTLLTRLPHPEHVFTISTGVLQVLQGVMKRAISGFSVGGPSASAAPVTLQCRTMVKQWAV